jgi:YebC/PmpR family DNA-binding regulatory protein
MSGHNKWSKIKHKKATADAKKSQEFSKLARFLTSESKKVGGDANSPTLRTAIDKARAVNMPKDNIERAIARGKAGDTADMEAITYEAYGPGGVALIIETLTDSKNRTNQEIKHIFTKRGLAISTPGSASWAFEKIQEGWSPQTTVNISEADEKKLTELTDTLEEHEDVQEVFTNAL